MRTVSGRRVQLVVAQKPRGYIAILSQLQRLVKLDLERRTAPGGKRRRAFTGTTDRGGGQPGLEVRNGAEHFLCAEPGVDWWLRIQVGSDVYDGSVRARLEGLRESF